MDRLSDEVARISCSTSDPPEPTHVVMRLVLEWLGFMRPDPARKEPVAVPAWAPYAVAAIIAVTATGSAALLRLVIGASV